MISNLKISDGDLLVIHMEGTASQAIMENYKRRLEMWIKSRGLQNVEIMVSSGEMILNITKFTVNDVFEEEVLKGDDNG